MAFDDISINTVIGHGSSLKGSIRIAGIVHINGDIDGSLDATGDIFIHEDARLRADVHAKTAVIGGIVEGDVIAPESVTILSTGMVVGNILTKKLIVEDDVILHGNCSALGSQEKFDSALESYYTRKAVSQPL